MGHYREWSGIRRRVQVLAFAGLLGGLAIAVPSPASAATGTIVVSGTVSCQWHAVVGVYVESGGGGSGWAGWQRVGGHTNIVTYEAKIQNTTLPTNIRLHVGCGGSASDWWSTNLTGSTSQAGGPLTGNATLNAVCNEGQSAPVVPPAGQYNCWFGYGSAAAAWATQHLTGAGATHALPGDQLDGNPAGLDWSGMCLAFADSAYWTAFKNAEVADGWTSVSPNVDTDAADMYSAYEAAGLVHPASEIPPVGAFVFYPGLDHIGISIGWANVITANTGTGAVVKEQGYNSGNLSGYAGWAYPTTAFRGVS